MARSGQNFRLKFTSREHLALPTPSASGPGLFKHQETSQHQWLAGPAPLRPGRGCPGLPHDASTPPLQALSFRPVAGKVETGEKAPCQITPSSRS